MSLPVFKLLQRPVKTHTPANAPKWFQDYVKANNEWAEDAHATIKALYDYCRSRDNSSNPAAIPAGGNTEPQRP